MAFFCRREIVWVRKTEARCKNNAKFISTCALIISTFFRSVQTSCNLIRSVSNFFDVNVKKLKDPGDKFEPYAFVQDLCWLLTQWSRVLFQMWITWKISTVILFISNMTEKDICCAHTFRSLDCIFYFSIYGLSTTLMTPKGKKKNK